MEKFRHLGLSETLLHELQKKGFSEPTEIQAAVIPLLLGSDVDIIGQAQTGTGKTAAFGLPLVETIDEHTGSVRAIILVPTRELAIQVSDEINSLKGKKKIRILPVYGGQSMTEQMRHIKAGIDIVVGTPGRIMDHLRRKSLCLENVSYAVLDEADEMLNMGFIDDVETILSKTNPEKRTLLFSATMSDHILKIAQRHMRKYEVISVKKNSLTVAQTEQKYYQVSSSDKFEALRRILDIESDFYGLIFCGTKSIVDELAGRLVEWGYNAEGIHGDYSQSQRESTLNKFRKKRVNILVATDVAARGIDITDLTHVINYSLPRDAESYIHRIGRTGRAGKKGTAITFVSASELRKLTAISRITKTEIRREQLPSISDIIHAKKDRLSCDLRAIREQGLHGEYLEIAAQMLNESDPADILAALMKHVFKGELEKSNYPEIKQIKDSPAKRGNPHIKGGAENVVVSLGKRDGLTPKKLLRFIQNESNIQAKSIREITIKESVSFLSVHPGDADRIVKAFKNHRRNSKPLVYTSAPSVASKNKKIGSRWHRA